MSEPERIVLVVCPVCGRTDRWSALHIGRAHFSEGKKCDGELVEVEYVLRSQLAEREAEVVKLVKALRDYGRHGVLCRSRQFGGDVNECDCGLRAALIESEPGA